jgi:hypothetical protein
MDCAGHANPNQPGRAIDQADLSRDSATDEPRNAGPAGI